MKLFKLITYLFLFFSSQLFAGGNYPDTFYGGYTLGAQWANQNAFNGYLLTFGFTDPWYTVDVGIGFGDYGVLVNGTRPSRTMVDLLGHLGLRSQLDQNLYVSYGGIWSVRTNSNKIGAIGELTTPYTLGAFAGLDWQPIQHLLMSFKIEPFSYNREFTRTNDFKFFRSGSLTASYVF